MTDLYQKYNIPVPRYTSYPTAPLFHDGVGYEDVAKWLAALPAEDAISLYVHVPFCRQLCYYCGCHMKVVNGDKAIQEYVETLLRDIDQTADAIGRTQPVSHMHWGGGTPSVTPAPLFRKLMEQIRTKFAFTDDAEVAIELDPRVLTQDYVAMLADVGINRASIGVQDFDLAVQQAINRVQSYEETENVMTWLRAHDINHINFDLIYGLPEQTLETITTSVELTEQLAPTRIALFGYAHVPWMKKHQKILEQYDLPEPTLRQEMFEHAREMLERIGYVRVGYDHFAHPEDPMAIAFEEGTLHRNFQGFTTDQAEWMVSLGSSSISCLPGGYAQNFSDISDYRARVDNGLLPIQRGVEVTAEDILRRKIIERLMCDYAVDVTAVCQQQNMDEATVGDAWDKLAPLVEDDIIAISGTQVTVTEIGRPFVRVVASCFDAYFQPKEGQHAKAV